VEQVLAAFAPLLALKITSAKQCETWGKTWLAWIADCGERYEQRPAEPLADDLHLVMIRSLRMICSAACLGRFMMRPPAQPGLMRTLIHPGPIFGAHVTQKDPYSDQGTQKKS